MLEIILYMAVNLNSFISSSVANYLDLSNLSPQYLLNYPVYPYHYYHSSHHHLSLGLISTGLPKSSLGPLTSIFLLQSSQSHLFKVQSDHITSLLKNKPSQAPYFLHSTHYMLVTALSYFTSVHLLLTTTYENLNNQLLFSVHVCVHTHV